MSEPTHHLKITNHNHGKAGNRSSPQDGCSPQRPRLLGDLLPCLCFTLLPVQERPRRGLVFASSAPNMDRVTCLVWTYMWHVKEQSRGVEIPQSGESLFRIRALWVTGVTSILDRWLWCFMVDRLWIRRVSRGHRVEVQHVSGQQLSILLILTVCPAWVARYMIATCDVRVLMTALSMPLYFLPLMRSINLRAQCDPQWPYKLLCVKAPLCKDFSVSKPLRVQAFPCKSFSVKKLLCVYKRLIRVKASVCASFSVSRLLCIKTSLCKSFCV